MKDEWRMNEESWLDRGPSFSLWPFGVLSASNTFLHFLVLQCLEIYLTTALSYTLHLFLLCSVHYPFSQSFHTFIEICKVELSSWMHASVPFYSQIFLYNLQHTMVSPCAFLSDWFLYIKWLHWESFTSSMIALSTWYIIVVHVIIQ